MLEYVLNTSSNVFCQYCPRREGLRHWSSAEEHLPSFLTVDRHHTGQERTTKRRCHVWWVESFALCFSSVHGWMGMAVWVNVFPMPYLRADSGPWRKMSRAWPAMSAITTSSGSTCPSHQESAWGASEARQDKVILEVVRKGIVGGRCCNICWTHLQMFSVSTVLGQQEGLRRGAVMRSRC